MSKSPPEVWDFKSAEAFIKAGRNPTKRPLKDGWNTQLVKMDDKQYDIQLHEEGIIAYTDDDHIFIFKGEKQDFVKQARVEKYALGDRYKIVPTGGVWKLWEASGALAHAVGDDPVRYYQPLLLMPETLELDDKRDLVVAGGHPKPTPLSVRERNILVRGMQRTWVKEYMKRLESPGMVADTDALNMCQACRPATEEPAPSWASALGDAEHVFAHLFEPAYPPRMVIEAVGTWLTRGGKTVEDFLPTSGGLMIVDPKHKMPVHRALINLLQRSTKVY